VPDEPAPRPSVPIVPLSHWEGAADPAYLLAEIEELRRVAAEGGLGTLAYLLEMAAIECRHQVKLKSEDQA
jgi:hypothetical protein